MDPDPEHCHKHKTGIIFENFIVSEDFAWASLDFLLITLLL